MTIKYVCKDVKLTKAMEEACESKLSRFDRYFRERDTVDCVVTLSIHQDKKSLEIAIDSTNGFALRAKTIDEDFYAALDVIIEKLDGQMRKLKTQLSRQHKKRSFSENLMMENIPDFDNLDVEIVRHKKLSLAPMDLDEALARMDALGHSFFIYLDSSTGLVNVLYERKDHGYGLIEIDK